MLALFMSLLFCMAPCEADSSHLVHDIIHCPRRHHPLNTIFAGTCIHEATASASYRQYGMVAQERHSDIASSPVEGVPRFSSCVRALSVQYPRLRACVRFYPAHVGEPTHVHKAITQPNAAMRPPMQPHSARVSRPHIAPVSVKSLS
jgi:hypothetical protein